MSSPIGSPAGKPSSNTMWPALLAYTAPPIAAATAIIPVFRDMIAKSALQKGQPLPHLSILSGVREGFKAAPTVGVIVGSQMLLQQAIEKTLIPNENQKTLSSMLLSSAIVGTVSAPILAVFNGQTMGWCVRESLRKFSVKQGLAITVQETAFVCGLSAADRLALIVKQQFGDNQFLEYSVAFISGALGSIAGHPANTALTRWQNGLTLDHAYQGMWGCARKARAMGVFTVFYKLINSSILNRE